MALGGLTAQAQAKVDARRLRVAVWDAKELVDRLLKYYEVLLDEIKEIIPLRRGWAIDESATPRREPPGPRGGSYGMRLGACPFPSKLKLPERFRRVRGSARGEVQVNDADH